MVYYSLHLPTHRSTEYILIQIKSLFGESNELKMQQWKWKNLIYHQNYFSLNVWLNRSEKTFRLQIKHIPNSYDEYQALLQILLVFVYV